MAAATAFGCASAEAPAENPANGANARSANQPAPVANRAGNQVVNSTPSREFRTDLQPKNDPNDPAVTGRIEAPDDSTFRSEMDKSGNFKEIREFRNNPYIGKVERKILGADSKYYVYLKNGKVVEAPADKMANFRALAPSNILEIIGVKPPAANIATGETKRP